MFSFFKKKKKRVPLAEHRRIVKALREEIKRKDTIIRELREKNDLVLNASLRQATRNKEIIGIVGKLKDQITDLEHETEKVLN